MALIHRHTVTPPPSLTVLNSSLKKHIWTYSSCLCYSTTTSGTVGYICATLDKKFHTHVKPESIEYLLLPQKSYLYAFKPTINCIDYTLFLHIIHKLLIRRALLIMYCSMFPWYFNSLFNYSYRFRNGHGLRNNHQRRTTPQNTTHSHQTNQKGTSIYTKRPRTTPWRTHFLPYLYMVALH